VKLPRRRSFADDVSPAVRGLSKRIDAEQTFDDGECIVSEGSPGRAMYIVAEGRVRIVKSFGGGDVTLGYIERGDFFGEMSLLESLPRYAGAFAVGPTRVVMIEPGSLMLRIRHDPSLAIEMMQRLSGRLRLANSRLVQILDENGDASVPPIWEAFDEERSDDVD
jgi:CRP/FNR family transcriptional regulator/CRP/FNR family cyclic AMP-dependent transcriptional regulator